MSCILRVPHCTLTDTSPDVGVGSFPDSVAKAKAMVMFNLASVYCIRRETEKAKKALLQVSTAL